MLSLRALHLQKLRVTRAMWDFLTLSGLIRQAFTGEATRSERKLSYLVAALIKWSRESHQLSQQFACGATELSILVPFLAKNTCKEAYEISSDKQSLPPKTSLEIKLEPFIPNSTPLQCNFHLHRYLPFKLLFSI